MSEMDDLALVLNIEVSRTEYFTINGQRYTRPMAEKLYRKLKECLGLDSFIDYPPGVRDMDKDINRTPKNTEFSPEYRGPDIPEVVYTANGKSRTLSEVQIVTPR